MSYNKYSDLISKYLNNSSEYEYNSNDIYQRIKDIYYGNMAENCSHCGKEIEENHIYDGDKVLCMDCAKSITMKCCFCNKKKSLIKIHRTKSQVICTDCLNKCSKCQYCGDFYIKNH